MLKPTVHSTAGRRAEASGMIAIIASSLLLGLICVERRAAAEDKQPTAEQIEFFETRIRPVLVERCQDCHGPDEQSSDLRVDQLSGLLRGGKAGPAIVPGKPEQSLLLTAIRYVSNDLQMPPDEKLSKQQIADFTRWIAMGAPHPDSDTARPLPTETFDWESARDFWAFQPPVDPPVPSVKDTAWPRSPLDHFILAELEAKGLRPAPAADKRTLIRRATFDLIGLPPTVEEIENFLSDDSPDAFARVVDRLLDSVHYGERWGRHWLDVARYADSNGLDENIAYGNAWRYRDYVVEAFNKDKPYDQFVVEQLAGDLLPKTGDWRIRHERLIATGFLSLGPKVLAEVDETKMEMDIIDEQVDTVSRAFMALTMGCARCHDHKFDPLPTKDYYGLAGIFKSTRTMEHFRKIARWYENPLETPERLAVQEKHASRVTAKKQEIESFVQQANADYLKTLAEQSQEAGEQPKLPKNIESLYPEGTKKQLKQLRDELAALEKAAPVMPTALGVTEGEPTDVAVHVRGSHLTLGDIVPRHFPKVLAGTDQDPLGNERSGRLKFARWLVQPDHPLTSRVMANRIWRWHFGQGIVATPDNFGKLGERPSNQPLLDWLAHRFIESGWSIKAMHRLIMLSSTYRMSSDYDPVAAKADPENRLHWRHNVQRLEAEAVRDTLLSVGGLLDLSMGGSLLNVGNREFVFNHTSEDNTKYNFPRRSLYLPVIRNNLYDVFQLFDYSDASVLNGNRTSTVVAPQALFMMNSEMVANAADNLTEKLLSDPELTDSDRMQALYLRSYGRPVTADEVERNSRFLERFTAAAAKSGMDADAAQKKAWAALCQVVFAASEFIYIR